VFERGEKRLIFVAGDHASGIDSAVAKTVRGAFNRRKPQAVVVEGLVSGDEADTAGRLRSAKDFAAKRPREFPENYYPIYLADRAKIPFAGGEPALKAKLEYLQPFGYSAEDLLGLSVASNVGALHKDCADRAKCARMLDFLADKVAKELDLGAGWDFAGYEQWYARRAELEKPANSLTTEDCRPDGGPKATFLQMMGYRLELIREAAIVRQISALLNAHDRVLVVYGSGHLLRQRPVWIKALGPSKESKPF